MGVINFIKSYRTVLVLVLVLLFESYRSYSIGHDFFSGAFLGLAIAQIAVLIAKNV